MSTESSFRAALGRRGPVPATPRAASGSAVAAVLRLRRDPAAGLPARERPLAARALAFHGVGIRKAHAVLDRIAADGEAAIELPRVPDLAELRARLAAHGIEVAPRAVPPMVDLKALRGRLGLTQDEFAARYALSLDSVRNWEQGRASNGIDRTARILLALIERHPDLVERMVEEAASAPEAAE